MNQHRRIRVVSLWLGAALFAIVPACDDDDGGPGDTVDDIADVVDDTTPDGTDEADAEETTDIPEEEVADPCPEYPCAPYGTGFGDVVRNLDWDVANLIGNEYAGGDENLSLQDLYGANEAHGGDLKGLMIFVTTGWCPYCKIEAPKLEALWQEYRDQGILVVGLVVQDTYGDPADGRYGRLYAAQNGWTFPVIVGTLAASYWDAVSVATDQAGSVPFHIFLDLRNMRIWGRFAGGTDRNVLKTALDELVAGPEWTADGERVFPWDGNDCAPGTGTEVEPNGLSETPEDGTSLSFTMTAVTCPPVIADGLFMDEDVVDLGNLSVGDVIQVEASRTGVDSESYPAFVLVRVAGSDAIAARFSPVQMDGSTVRRQFVIDTAGHYLVGAYDARVNSSGFYSDPEAVMPDSDACCTGGADHAYSLTISTATLAATDDAVLAGTPVVGTFEGGDLNVYPLTVTNGTAYEMRLVADTWDTLDPFLFAWDPSTSSIIEFNDNDPAGADGELDSLLSWTATSDSTIWIIADYWLSYFYGGPAGYTLDVTAP